MADITPAVPGYDDPVRAEGTAKLKQRMGGNVPWYKERAATPRNARIDQMMDMADTAIIGQQVPRRPAPAEEPGN